MAAPVPPRYKRFPWGDRWNIKTEHFLSQFEVELGRGQSPYLLSPAEFSAVLCKAEDLCTKLDGNFASQLVVILWGKQCLDKDWLFPSSHKIEWVLRIKRAARLALKTMRDGKEDPILYFPNTLLEYEKKFAD